MNMQDISVAVDRKHERLLRLALTLAAILPLYILRAAYARRIGNRVFDRRPGIRNPHDEVDLARRRRQRGGFPSLYDRRAARNGRPDSPFARAACAIAHPA